MPNSNRFKMSQERLDALKDELYYLETVREKEVSELNQGSKKLRRSVRKQ